MSLSIVHSRAQYGVQTYPITVEVHSWSGLPEFSIVGLPEKLVKETKNRVRSAVYHSRFRIPSGRITINLAPADFPKSSGCFDLPITIGLLCASKQISHHALEKYEMMGELALSGQLRPIRGCLPIAVAAAKAKRTLILPRGNAQEARLISDGNILLADTLLDVCWHLIGETPLPVCSKLSFTKKLTHTIDMNEVVGQSQAKRAFEIAAAGGHNLMMVGPPGAGKTMMAERLPSLLPPLTHAQALKNAMLRSITFQKVGIKGWYNPPFRAPHHTASAIALVGGGSPPKPGEISLAQHGVLFLDELPEYPRQVLESLREPLESGVISIARAGHHVVFPAQFQLIAAMNPCPCGYLGDTRKPCTCRPDHIARYHARLSGPLLDRIDMHLRVNAMGTKNLLNDETNSRESSAMIRERVVSAQAIAMSRQGSLNAQLKGQDLKKWVVLGESHKQLLSKAIDKWHLSSRACHRLMRLARTIADLAGCESVSSQDIAEALVFRQLRLDDRDSL